MPQNMAMQCPHARVISRDPKHNVRIPGYRNRVAPHRILQVPGCLSVAKQSLSPANDLELLAAVSIVSDSPSVNLTVVTYCKWNGCIIIASELSTI